MNRSIQVEGAFGILKKDYNFQRFMLRGKTKVKLEILLLCMAITSTNYMERYKKTRQEVISFQSKGPHKPQKNGGIIKVC